jgi:hypothetical protein
VLTVSGEMPNILEALIYIFRDTFKIPVPIELYYFQLYAGTMSALVGSKGSTIKGIIERCGTSFNVSIQTPPNSKGDDTKILTCALYGEPESVTNAINEIKSACFVKQSVIEFARMVITIGAPEAVLPPITSKNHLAEVLKCFCFFFFSFFGGQ